MRKYLPPPSFFSINDNLGHKKILAVTVAAVLSGLTLSIANATEYTQHINNGTGEEQYDAIRSGDSVSGYIYKFTDGDSIVIENNSRNYVIGGTWSPSFTISGNITLRSSASRSGDVFIFDGIDSFASSNDYSNTITTDDIAIDLIASGTNNSGNQYVAVNGINNTWNTTHTGKVEIKVTAQGNNAYAAFANGIAGINGATITFKGGMLEATADNDGFASHAYGINLEGYQDRASSISASTATTINVKANSSSTASNSQAVAEGIANLDYSDGSYLSTVTLQDVTIDATATAAAGVAEALGILSGKNGVTTVGQGDFNIKAYSSDNVANAYGLYTEDNGVIYKDTGNLIVTATTAAYGIVANSGTITYAGGTITATAQDSAVGIFADTNAQVNLTGNTLINAGDALAGAGTVTVAGDSVFNGDYAKFTGSMYVTGSAALGMTQTQADTYTTDGASLSVLAGSTLYGRYTVGTQGSAPTALGSALNLLSDGTLIIVADKNYDGSSALVTVDSVTTAASATVRLENSAYVKNGTTVFAATDINGTYNFETDNLLTAVIDNKIMRRDVRTVFGDDLLIGDLVDEALNGSGLGSERIIALTGDSNDAAVATKNLNQIALMGVGSGAQVAAFEAGNNVINSIIDHGSKIAAQNHHAQTFDVWVDLNGTSYRANRFKTGSTQYGLKSDLFGASVGADYSLTQNLTYGAAVSFGSGSVRGHKAAFGTKNDVAYQGINLYGIWNNEYFNLLATLGYLHSDNDIAQNGYSATTDVNVLTTAVKLEKPFSLTDNLLVTPHVGVEWSVIDADNFVAGGFSYKNETVNLLTIPVGVAFSDTLSLSQDLTLAPYVDLEIAPVSGDTNTEHSVMLNGGSAATSFNTRIVSSVLYNGRVGVAGNIGTQHNFGLNYGISAGNGDYLSHSVTAFYRYAF